MRIKRKSPEIRDLEEHVCIIVRHFWVGETGMEEACAQAARALGMTPRRVRALLHGEARATDEQEVEAVKKAVRDRYLVKWMQRQRRDFTALTKWSGRGKYDVVAEAREIMMGLTA